jgi:hypothetical protein
MPTTLITTRRRRAPAQPNLDGIADDWVTFPAVGALIGARS